MFRRRRTRLREPRVERVRGSGGGGWPRLARSRRLARSCRASAPGTTSPRGRVARGRREGGRVGRRYARCVALALDARAAAVGVTSWNEWGEGTQIRPGRREPCAAAYDVAEDARARRAAVARGDREDARGARMTGGTERSRGGRNARARGFRVDVVFGRDAALREAAGDDGSTRGAAGRARGRRRRGRERALRDQADEVGGCGGVGAISQPP